MRRNHDNAFISGPSIALLAQSPQLQTLFRQRDKRQPELCFPESRSTDPLITTSVQFHKSSRPFRLHSRLTFLCPICCHIPQSSHRGTHSASIFLSQLNFHLASLSGSLAP